MCTMDVICIYSETELRVHFTSLERLGEVKEMLWK